MTAGKVVALESEGRSEVVAEYVTMTHELGNLLLSLPDMRCNVGVGVFKAAPIRVEVQLMTSDLRSGWHDRHVDETAVSVVVLRETSRAVAAPAAARGDDVDRHLTDRHLTQATSVLAVIGVMRRCGGGFVQALAEAASKADPENLSRLQEAFPEFWQRYSQLANDLEHALRPETES